VDFALTEEWALLFKKVTVRLLAMLILIVAMGMFPGGSARSASCEKLSPEEHIAIAPIVFLGIPGKDVGGSRDNEYRVVRFQVLRTYKGVVRPTISVGYVNDHGGNSGWGFVPGRTTLVFAYDVSEDPQRDADAYVYFCSMIHFYARDKLHAEYWQLINTLRP